MVSTFLLAAVLGCSSPPAEPQPQPRATPQAPARKAPVKAKAKTGNLAPGGGTRKAPQGRARPGARAPAGKALPPPVGASGPIQGTLVLEVAKAEPGPVPPPAEGEAPPAEGAAPAPAKPTPAPETTATMKLAWGEGQTAESLLGSVEGSCTSVEPKPVGPEGRQRTPLWTVSCEHEGKTTELYILQISNLLAVVRGTPTGNAAKPMAYKPVRRVRLASGAKLERAG